MKVGKESWPRSLDLNTVGNRGAEVNPMYPRWCRGRQPHHPGFHLLNKSEHGPQPARRFHAIYSRKPHSPLRLAVADKLGQKGASLRSHSIPVKRGTVEFAWRTFHSALRKTKRLSQILELLVLHHSCRRI